MRKDGPQNYRWWSRQTRYAAAGQKRLGPISIHRVQDKDHEDHWHTRQNRASITLPDDLPDHPHWYPRDEGFEERLHSKQPLVTENTLWKHQPICKHAGII